MLCVYHRPYLGFIIKPSHWFLDSEYTYCSNNVTALAHTLFVFLSCFSKTTMSSFRIFTISVGFLCDLLNKGIFACIEISSNMGCYKQTKNMNKKESTRYISYYQAALSLPFNTCWLRQYRQALWKVLEIQREETQTQTSRSSKSGAGCWGGVGYGVER